MIIGICFWYGWSVCRSVKLSKWCELEKLSIRSLASLRTCGRANKLNSSVVPELIVQKRPYGSDCKKEALGEKCA